MVDSHPQPNVLCSVQSGPRLTVTRTAGGRADEGALEGRSSNANLIQLAGRCECNFYDLLETRRLQSMNLRITFCQDTFSYTSTPCSTPRSADPDARAVGSRGARY